MRWVILGVVGLAAVAGPTWAQPAKAAGWQTEMSTPPGITLQYVTNPRSRAGFFIQGEQARGHTIGFGNAQGKSLYTFDDDTVAGQSSCTDACATEWPAAQVPAGAKPSSRWTIIARKDGIKQWAYNGKPLYACAKDPEVGQAKCADAKWHMVKFESSEGMATPPAIKMINVPSAGGETLVTASGMTLYFQNDAAKGKKACPNGSCGNTWKVVAAPALAAPIGEFTVVRAMDGSKQWAFRGNPLFTYANDIETGDSDGKNVDGWSPAVVFTSFMPDKAHVVRPIGFSDVIANGKGLALYKRDVSYQIVTGHGLAQSVPTIPAIGRAVGVSGCEAECLEQWKPYVASKGAQPSGFWEIAVRPDGTRQWTYQGYPLYTFVKDVKPGDVKGEQTYDVYVNDGDNPGINVVAPTTNGWALYWSLIEPT